MDEMTTHVEDSNEVVSRNFIEQIIDRHLTFYLCDMFFTGMAKEFFGKIIDLLLHDSFPFMPLFYGLGKHFDRFVQLGYRILKLADLYLAWVCCQLIILRFGIYQLYQIFKDNPIGITPKYRKNKAL